MKQNKSASSPKSGMNRDANVSDLKNVQYTLGVNINSNSETGDEYTITNEPSNYFGVQFPESYRVIFFINNPLKSRTYYFLTSIDSNENSVNFKRSSIGYSDSDISEIYNQDEECGDCKNEKNILSTPLEDITQTPSNTYVELLHDRCVALADIEEKGLNFNINFPIKKGELKQEKLGTTLYWNDNRNPFRYLQIGRIEEALENETFDYLHSENIACEDPQETYCLDVDKLLVNPKHSRLRIEADKEQTGGNLKQGTYEFWGAYCDAYGNETTEYSTPTNPISIWDENNYIQAQTETDDFTNFAIKLKVTNLDKDTFKYYKIAVVERNNVNNTQSVFLAGIYPTTDDVVVYTHSGSSNDDLYITRGNVSLKKRMDFSTLTAIKPQYIKAKGTMTSDDRLWSFGLEEEQEINIQPIVNLFSGLVKAQTSAVSENLYKSAIATSKYKQYPRNEVQPLGIRLLYNDGGYSSTFPFVGRPKDSNDAEIIPDINTNKASLIASENACNENTRQEKWQIFNTASEINAESCFDLDANSIELPPQELEKICYVDIATVIPTNTITLELTDTFYDLESYVEDNPSLVIPEITPYLETVYLENCTPSYVGDCTTPVLDSQEVEIDEVINEVQTFNYKEDNEYLMTVSPQLCNPYKRNTTTGEYLLDTEIDSTLIPCLASVRRELYLRDSGFQNENCAYATELPLQINPSSPFSSVFFNYDISDTLANLLVDNSALTTTNIATGFNATIHNKAQFFRIEKKGREQIILEITKKSNCIGEGDLFDFINNNQLRYTVYNNCSGTTELAGDIVDVSTGYLITLDTTNYPDTFYVVIDAKIETIEVPYDCGTPLTTRPVYFVSPPCSCIGIYQRNVEIKSVTVEWDSITMRKKMTYTASCVTYLPKVNDCDPIPYKKYKMAYWESVNDYPDNKQLYDSSTLLIRSSDLNLLTASDKLDFEEYFTEGLNFNGVYELKPTTDLRCQPIRHPKFPDNTVSPFMIDNINHAESADSIIFPMGVNLDSKIVQTMIEVAYNNKFLTKKQKEKIVGWEILRGDNSIHKSVTSSGILYDLYKYEKKNDSIYFSNFPFNDLGENKFVKDPTTKQLIQHPFGGQSNNKFTYLSPDMFLTKPQIPTEMSLQGYMFGSADMGFADVEKHPQWTVLGKDAYTLSEVLAAAELTLELIIKTAEFTTQSGIGNLWVIAGVSTGTNAAGAGASGAAIGVFIAGYALQSIVKFGEYRYNWLQIFRNLGRADNFASFQYGAGKHNRLLKINNEDDNYLRRLTLRKHLKEGNYTFIDENNGSELRINNDSREHSVLLSTGDFSINYPDEYINFDNNKLSSTSSNFLASQTGCDNDVRNRRDIANPYVQLKNYVPDQWDTIDSIKWLTTNYIFNLQEDTECKPIYGGTQVISRFSWRIKVPFFRDNAIKLADKLPYLYTKNSNIGDVAYFCNYETAEDTTFNFIGTVFPDIRSEYNFDCQTGRNSFYLRPPSKFYLYTHGIIDFLVESEINCNFRYGKKEPENQFYNGQPLSKWLQEVNLPIIQPNTFFYNNTYSFPVSNTPYKKLDRTYDKDIWAKRALKPNAWIWSEKDVNENALVDPWLVFKPLNFWEDKTSRGKLIDLRSIESDQFLGRYEDQLQLFNQANNVADAINNQNKELGTGFLYSRPISFKKADLGFAGTQNTDFVSTPYGHFWVDAKRGRIFQVDQNGGNMEIISEVIKNQPSGMKQWFREHLPFKILKQFPQIDVDNKFKGLGMNIWYDDRNSRVFFTKRDYVAINTANLNYEEGLGFYTQDSLPEITCSEGYEYNVLTDMCELITVSDSCLPGFTYNVLTNMCEQESTCDEGLDIVFILDATGSQQTSIDNIKNAISTDIVPAIVANFGANYRLGLISVKDRRGVGQALFDILEPMSIANETSFLSEINGIVAAGGANSPEPTNTAIEATLSNTTAVDLNGTSLGGDTIGVFRTNAAKVIILVTDNTPSGLDDNYTNDDWLNADALTTQADLQGIQIFSYLTTPTEPTPTSPPTPNVTYVMQNYATKTAGAYYFTPLGVGISDGVVDAIVSGIVCPPPVSVSPSCEEGCTQQTSNCICIDSEEPVRGGIKTPIYFDNTNYFKDVSFTISFKPNEGWNSYFSFYPDFSVAHNGFFQTGFNWGISKGTMWSHLLNNNSFGVFQGVKHGFALEFPISNSGGNKILNSLSIGVESKRYLNGYDEVFYPNKGVTDMYIYNSKNNSGNLVLHPQENLASNRKYPYLENGKQHIQSTFTEGKQITNYFFNRFINERNGINQFIRDENNIFKTINPKAVSFTGKRILERISGDNFIAHIGNTQDSQFNILIKYAVSSQILTE